MKCILVVEDNELNKQLIRDILFLESYEIIEAEDGQEGVNLAHQHNPDLILMDIQLDKMDGIKATQILKESKETRQIPIIALTSYAYESDRQAFLDAGGNMFMTKPIDVDELLHAIKSILEDTWRPSST